MRVSCSCVSIQRGRERRREKARMCVCGACPRRLAVIMMMMITVVNARRDEPGTRAAGERRRRGVSRAKPGPAPPMAGVACAGRWESGVAPTARARRCLPIPVDPTAFAPSRRVARTVPDVPPTWSTWSPPNRHPGVFRADRPSHHRPPLPPNSRRRRSATRRTRQSARPRVCRFSPRPTLSRRAPAGRNDDDATHAAVGAHCRFAAVARGQQHTHALSPISVILSGVRTLP